MLEASLKAQLASYLERISQPIEIVASLDDTPASGDMRALLKDIAETSPPDQGERVPAATPHALLRHQPAGRKPRPALRRPAHGP
jgi:alkyl hydroperoxide reductase subunit AhpF